jgi:glycine dehydrogenase subunit 1
MRYLPLTDTDRTEMLNVIGASSIDDLFIDVPPVARRSGSLDLPQHQPELLVERQLTAMAGKNLSAGQAPFFLGCGAYRHHVPASVDHLIQRSEFLTSYTPYQPEIAQGTLQVLFEFQTQVAMLTQMEVANASMYDGSTAAAEAVLMAGRVTRRKRAVISGGLHPHYRDVIATMSALAGDELVICPPSLDDGGNLSALIDDQTACVVVQNPNFFGTARDFTDLAAAAHARGALLIVVVTEILSLGLMTPPGDMGADIVVGEGQSIGNGLNFGGPYVGLFATREKFIRQMPGRLAGETVDSTGKRGFVLTLSTREQHIRRDKATSNICTNSGLCALAFSIHLTLMGEAGLTKLAEINHATASLAAEKLSAVPGVKLLNDHFFNEFTLDLGRPAAPIVEALAVQKILGGVPASRLLPDEASAANYLIIAATETNTESDIEQLADALNEVLS